MMQLTAPSWRSRHCISDLPMAVRRARHASSRLSPKGPSAPRKKSSMRQKTSRRSEHALGTPQRRAGAGAGARYSGSCHPDLRACNFQDLTAQRITKVVATLNFVEDRITRMMEAWGGTEAFRLYTAAAIGARENNGRLHGPKLEGDVGYATQEDVDALFAAE